MRTTTARQTYAGIMRDTSARVRVYEGHSIGSHTPHVSGYERRTVTVGTLRRWFADYRARGGTYGHVRDERDANGYGTITFSYYVSGCPNNHRFIIEPVDIPAEKRLYRIAHRAALGWTHTPDA